MARVTIEDCLRVIPNHFELVIKAAERARQLAKGSAPEIAEDDDKPTVLALREIAAKLGGISYTQGLYETDTE